MNDQDVRFLKVTDAPRYDSDGNVIQERVYTFKIGTHGPFTERVPLANFDERAIHTAVDRLKRELNALPT